MWPDMLSVQTFRNRVDAQNKGVVIVRTHIAFFHRGKKKSHWNVSEPFLKSCFLKDNHVFTNTIKMIFSKSISGARITSKYLNSSFCFLWEILWVWRWELPKSAVYFCLFVGSPPAAEVIQEQSHSYLTWPLENPALVVWFNPSWSPGPTGHSLSSGGMGRGLEEWRWNNSGVEIKTKLKQIINKQLNNN